MHLLPTGSYIYSWQICSSGEIEEKDLSRAVGLERKLGLGVNRSAVASR
jgi:hypothetical protein